MSKSVTKGLGIPCFVCTTLGIVRFFRRHVRVRGLCGRFGHHRPRRADPDELSSLVALLMGPDGDYITGSNILIDGGGALPPGTTAPAPDRA